MALQHLHFVQSLEPLQGGGLGGAARQLHTALVAAGHRSCLVATRSASFAQEWPGVEQFVRFGPEKVFYSPGLRARINAVLDEDGEPIVIHGHGFYVYPNALLGRSARHRELPLVYHPHGMFEPWILSRSKRKKQVAHWLFEDANFTHAALWRALTAKEADQIRGQGITAPIVVLPNGIDIEEFRPAATRESTSDRILLFLGRIHPKKGIELLLSAWSKLGRCRAGWRLCLAGPDEAGYAGTVRAQIKSAGLEASVSMLGTLIGEAKLSALQNADAFVLTSFSEGLPMAALEAMACGLPVLITRECNLPEVEATGAGWVCSADNASVERVLRLLLESDSVERAQRGAAGRRLVEERFRWSAVARNLQEMCEHFL